jgi:hypothetical protein
MQVKEPDGTTRWQQADRAADDFAGASGLPENQVKRFAFAATAEPMDSTRETAPNGNGRRM